MKLLLCASLALTLSACSTVKPYQRELLAQPGMSLDPTPDSDADQHMLQSREGSFGGFAVEGRARLHVAARARAEAPAGLVGVKRLLPAQLDRQRLHAPGIAIEPQVAADGRAPPLDGIADTRGDCAAIAHQRMRLL